MYNILNDLEECFLSLLHVLLCVVVVSLRNWDDERPTHKVQSPLARSSFSGLRV